MQGFSSLSGVERLYERETWVHNLLYLQKEKKRLVHLTCEKIMKSFILSKGTGEVCPHQGSENRHRKPELTWKRCRPHPANLSPSQAGESCSPMPEYVNRIYSPRPIISTKLCSTFWRMFSYPAPGKYRNQDHRRRNQTEVAAKSANSVEGLLSKG